ncbi:MAG: hypothetical protein PHT07_10620 [Paludibacter sp.]|nr:hypothetical protein [Paludibacter sp.]
MSDDETLDLGHLLANHYEQINNQIGKIEPIKSSLPATENLPEFIDKLVQKIVFGPMQDVFSGEEIKAAINQSKAIDLASGFMDLSEKTLGMVYARNSAIDDRNFKDYRDFFAISVFTYLIKYSGNGSALNGFLLNCTVVDSRDREMWRTLGDFYITEMRDDTSGIMSLAMYLYISGAKGANTSDMISPVQFDTLFAVA